MADDSLICRADVFDHAPVGLAGIDGEGTIILANAYLSKLLGCSKEQVQGYKLHDLIDAPFIVEFTASLNDTFIDKKIKSCLEIPLRRVDDSIVWVNMTLGRLPDSNGKEPQRLSIIAEIKEKEGRTSQTLDRLMQVSPAVVYTMRADDLTTMTFVSENVLSVTGWTANALIDRPDWLEKHVHPDDFKRAFDELSSWLSRGAPGYARLHYRQRTPQGRWQWLDDQLTTVRDAQDRIVELVGAFRDVTDKVEITQRLEKLARNVPGVLFQYRRHPDGQVHFTYASEGALDIFGLPREQMEVDVSKTFGRIHPKDLPKLLSSMEDSFLHLKPWQLRLRVIHPQRGEIWIETRASPEREEDGSVLGHGVFLDITGEMEAEGALKQSRAELLEAQQLAHLGSWVWIIATDVLRWSEEVFRIFGMKQREFSTTIADFLQRVYIEDRERVRTVISEALQGSPYRIGFRILWPDGSIRHVDARGAVEFSSKGLPLRMIGTILDVTDLRNLEINQKRLVAILEHTPDVVAMLGPDGSLWYLNPAGRRQFGFPPADGEPWDPDYGWNTRGLTPQKGSVEDTIRSFYPKKEAERIIRVALPIALREGVWEGETLYLNAAGKEIQASQVIIVERDSNGAIYQTTEILRDVTHLRTIEDEQRLLAATFRSSQAIIITDSSWKIQRINPGFTSLMGYSSEEMVGRNPCSLLSNKQSTDFFEHIFHQIEVKGYWEGEASYLNRSGDVIPLHEFITPTYDTNGKLEHYIATFFDISRQKELERNLEYQSLYDPLTKTANRRHLEPLMEHEAHRASRYEAPCSLIMLDLDHFKRVNDTYGHNVGDETLRRVAATLNDRLRETDVIGRWGGEEFIVLLPDTTGEHARKVAEQLRIQVERLEIPEVGFITISLGVSNYQPGEDIKDWIKRADGALYAAKKLGRNRVG